MSFISNVSLENVIVVTTVSTAIYKVDRGVTTLILEVVKLDNNEAIVAL